MSKIHNFSYAFLTFGLIIVLFIIGFGLIVLFTNIFYYVPDSFRIIIGIFLLLYGVFRILTIIIKFKKLQNNQNEDEDN